MRFSMTNSLMFFVHITLFTILMTLLPTLFFINNIVERLCHKADGSLVETSAFGAKEKFHFSIVEKRYCCLKRIQTIEKHLKSILCYFKSSLLN